MPKPRVVPRTEIPDNTGRREKSSTQKTVDSYVGEMAGKLAEIASSPGTDSVLFEFDDTDDPGFRFTGASIAHLKDRCRRMMRTAMKDELPGDVDGKLSTTYIIPVTKLPTNEFEVSGFRAWVERKR